MKYIFTLVLSLLIYKQALSCSCAIPNRDSAVSEGLKYSDLVFYGELLKYDTGKGTFQFRIIELFKGKYEYKIVNGSISSSCSILPTDWGFWIVYSHFNKDSTISISSCSGSMSLRNPLGFLPPPPPPPNGDTKTNFEIRHLDAKIHILEARIRGLSYWLNDLEKLREYKRDHSVIFKDRDCKNIFILFLVIINVTLILILAFKIRK